MVSLVVAVVDRLPIRRRLLGFYLVHAGIVILMFGAILTRYGGLDGELILTQGQTTDQVRFGSLHLDIERGGAGNESTPKNKELVAKFPIPDLIWPYRNENSANPSQEKHWTIQTILPFSRAVKHYQNRENSWVSDWILRGPQAVEKFELAWPGGPAVSDQGQLGPLKYQAMEWSSFQILGGSDIGVQIESISSKETIKLRSLPARIKFKDGQQGTLREIKNEKAKVSYFQWQVGDMAFSFFPRFSEWPVTDSFAPKTDAGYRLWILDSDLAGATLAMAQDPNQKLWLAYRNKDGRLVRVKASDSSGTPITLPWMELGLSLQRHLVNQIPIFDFEPTIPEKDANRNRIVVEVSTSLESQLRRIWVVEGEETRADIAGVAYYLSLQKNVEKLPVSLSLNDFRMATNPGTDEAASFESTVTVFEKGGFSPPSRERIFMNHPLKKDGYTFYQASYFPDGFGGYGSVLSVNRDPGRPWKYSGSLILVIGFLIHYWLQRHSWRRHQ